MLSMGKHTRIVRKHLKKSYRRKLLLCILFPVFLTLLLYSAVNAWLQNNVKQQLLSQCRQSQRSFADNYEQNFYELYQGSLLLMDNQEFKDVCYATTPLSTAENYHFLNVVQTLTAFCATKPYLIQTGFINEINDRYISSSCTSFLKNYYSNSTFGNVINTHVSASTNAPSSVYQIHPLDTIQSQNVIPLTQKRIGNYQLPSPLILYISKASFSSGLSKYRLTANSSLYIYCPETRQIIASTKNSLDSGVIGLFQDTGNHFSEKKCIKLDNSKYYCFVSSSQKGYTTPLLYIMLVPFQDIKTQTNLSFWLSLFTLLFCCALTAVLSYLSAFCLYAPIEHIMRFIPGDHAGTDDSSDEITRLDLHIQDILSSNDQLNSMINHSLPLVFNRYINNILYQREEENCKLEPLISNYDFQFPYQNFTCSILIPQFSPLFYKDFSTSDQTLVISKLNDILSITSQKNCVKYVFYKEENCFLLITNSPETNHKTLLTEDFSTIQKLFSFDCDYIHLYVACGSTCHGLQNLHVSFREANAALSQSAACGTFSINFYSDHLVHNNHFRMTPESDNRLIAALYQNNKQAATDLVNQLLLDNQSESISEEGFKNLYIHLYEIGDQVFRGRHLDAQTLLEGNYISLSAFIHQLNNPERSSYIFVFYDALCNQASLDSSATSFNHDEIRNYIDQNYKSDICLESLAEKFHTSPKYISRIVKQVLGTSFKQYITILRIADAKEMLIRSNMKIDDIYTECGFHTRNSFIRIFKQMEGTTPSDFRNRNR